jgi:UDP-N-acetylmuramyl tripeptide synthase
MAIGRGLSADAIARGAGDVAVPGRLEKVGNARGVLCVVDYAHTPDGLERAIAAMRAVTARRLIVVFGAAAIAIAASVR